MRLEPFLDAVGIGKDRLRLEWISASEAPKVANTANDFTHSIKQLGAAPFNRKRHRD